MINIQNVQKKYKDQIVLSIEELSLKSGTCVGLLGNNGAGKTTLLSILLDLIKPDAGTTSIHSISTQTSDEWKQYTGAFLDEQFLIDFLTPEEYFSFIGGLLNLTQEKVDESLAVFEQLFNGEILDQKKYIRNLSKGNAKKVGIAAAFLGDLEYIILDEPFANLDPTSQFQLKKIIKELKSNRTILISSHDLNHVAELSDRIILLEKGILVKDEETNANTLLELESYFNKEQESKIISE